jgi:hypothetical protein
MKAKKHSILGGHLCVFFIEDCQMALSSSERLRLIMEESNRFVDRRRVRDASELTYIKQAKANTVVFDRTKTGTTMAKPAFKTNDAISKGLPNNGIADSEVGCSKSVFISGSETNNGYDALNLAAQGCAVCSDVDLSLLSSTRVDLRSLGAVVCYDHTKFPFSQNTAALTGFSSSVTSCAPKSNLQRFFPAAAQPNPECCTDTPDSLISMKFGSAGV